MGLLDGGHALAPFGMAWSWLRPGTTLLGGSLFALVWLPPALMTRKRFLFILALVLAWAGGVAVWLRPALLPTPLRQPGYAFASEAITIAGSTGFLAAALFFFRRCRRSPSRPDVLFAGKTLLFAAAGALLALSPLWAVNWWVWYGFRLTAYTVALFAAYETVVTAYRDQILLARRREEVIQEKTEELHRLAEIVESSDDAIFSKSLDGTITSWNSSAERMYGYSAAHAVGQPLALIVPAELQPEVRDILFRVARGEFVKHHETVRVRKDGARIDVSVTVSPIKERDGRVIGASAIARDITERKRAEAAQQESQEAFRLLTDAVPEMVWMCTPDGLNIYSSQQWVNYTGLTVEETYGHGWAAPFHPEDKQAAADAWRRTIAAGDNYCVESRLRAADGSYRWFLLRGLPMRDAAGRTVKWVGSCTDIDELKRAEKKLRRLNQQLSQASAYHRSLIEASLDPLVTIAPDGRITDLNKATEQATGVPRQLLIGTDFCDYFTDPDRARAAYLHAFRDGSTQDYELELRHRNGSSKPVLYNASLYVDDGGETVGVFAAARDITERKRVERELQDLNSSLERRVRDRTSDLLALNEELESFNYSVSHDLRSPLRHVDSYAKILEEYSSQMPADARLCVHRIREGALRMGCMVDELLALSRTSRREVSKQITGLGLLVREVIEELQPELRARDIEWHIGELPFADCDPALTRQVFANLLSNALKFSRTRKPAVIEVGDTVVDGQAALYVRDNGVGFSMNYADKLFGLFQRLHRREDFEGTGVGLVTVQRIIHKHGGRIWAEAEIEKGATFYFTLQSPANSPSLIAETETVSAERVS
jgi:PAS domain S-box-containing protein